MPNPYNRQRTKDNPYEIWETPDGTWKYYVLRKYKKEVKTDYDYWYCCVVSPMTPRGEYGDVYAKTVMDGTWKTFDCFAPSSTDVQTTREEPPPSLDDFPF